MSDRQIGSRAGIVAKALVAVLGTAGILAAVAYAAAPRGPGDPGPRSKPGPATGPLPAPEITRHPNKLATSANAKFDFTDRRDNLRFQCRLDRRGWRACQAPTLITGLAVGEHAFSVRARDNRGRRSRATRFRWRLLEPKDFSIQPELASLSLLFPGAPPVALPLVIANPNPVPIFVTSLQATTTADPPGCTSAENLALIQSSVSSAAPLRVPAGGSVSLPAAGVSAPAIQLRDLPVNQDACQNAQFPLAFAGRARG